MKKRIVLLLLVTLCLSALTGCSCQHSWTLADCHNPQTCQKCGETVGAPLDHNWADAGCDHAKFCWTCGATEGAPLGHSWLRATLTAPKTCEICGVTEGEPLGNDSFMESVDYLSVTAMLTESMPEYSPRFAYESEEATFYIHLDAPEGTADSLSADESGSWQTLSASLCDLSASILDTVTTAGYTIHCSVILYSDTDPDTILLTAADGVITYNAADTQ